MMANNQKILIAGGGPVGLILGYKLAKAGVDVMLFDKGDIVHQEPRAGTIHPATLDVLEDIGIYQALEKQGIVCPIVNYYESKDLIASFDHTILKGEVRYPWVLQCEQDKISRLLFQLAKEHRNFDIHTDAKVVGCSQDEHSASVVVEYGDGRRESYQGAYLIGADGAGSTIRKIIEVPFEGYTYPERFMIVGTPYDFGQHGYAYRNYLSDPDEWTNLFKISWKGPPGIYRLVAPILLDENLDGDAAKEIGQAKLQRFLPRDVAYDIVFLNTYVVSQKVAQTFRKGRILLTGDAAHLNSPIGAMGMNSGIQDADNLGSNLLRVINGDEGEEALDRYARQRRHVATEHVQPVTKANKRNMEQKDPAKRREYRDNMRRTAEDPALAKQFLMQTSLIDSMRDAERVR